MHLARFRSGLLRAIRALNVTNMAARHSDAFKQDEVRIATTSGLTRRQVGSDLGIGLSTLDKWVRAVSDVANAIRRPPAGCIHHTDRPGAPEYNNGF